MSRPGILESSLFLTWILLLWHGGLHAWQAPLGALGLILALTQRSLSFQSRTSIALSLLVFLAALGIPGSLNPQSSLDSVVLGALGILLVAALRNSPTPWMPAWSHLQVFAGLILAFLYLATALVHPFWGPALSARPWFPNQNLLSGGIFLPALLILLAPGIRGPLSWQKWAGALFLVLAIAYAGSRGVALALVGAFLWFGLRSRSQGKRGPYLAAIILAFFFGLQVWAPFATAWGRAQGSEVSKDAYALHRRVFWSESFRTSFDRPWLGHGVSSFSQAAWHMDIPAPADPTQALRYRLKLEHAHNEPLTVAVDMGWPATLLVLFFVLSWLRSRWKGFLRGPEDLGLEAALISALILGLTDMNWRTPVLLLACALNYAALMPLEIRLQERAPSKFLPGLLAVMLLMSAVGLYFKQAAFHRKTLNQPNTILLDVAAVLRPLDSALAAERFPRAWAWNDWSARYDALWWVKQADQAKDAKSRDKAWSEAIQQRPYYAIYWMGRGQDSFQEKRFAEAMACAKEALRLEPDMALAQELRFHAAQALGAREEEAEAWDDLRRIRMLLPNLDATELLNQKVMNVNWAQLEKEARVDFKSKP